MKATNKGSGLTLRCMGEWPSTQQQVYSSSTAEVNKHRDVYGRYCSLPYWLEQELWKNIVNAGVWDRFISPFKRPEKTFYVNTLTGKKIEIHAFGCEKILDVKEKIREKEGIPTGQQRLIFRGKVLEDTVTIDKYKIENGCVAHLVLLLRGGARTKQTKQSAVLTTLEIPEMPRKRGRELMWGKRQSLPRRQSLRLKQHVKGN
jgi:large subunit ribosomal protein L40e